MYTLYMYKFEYSMSICMERGLKDDIYFLTEENDSWPTDINVCIVHTLY